MTVRVDLDEFVRLAAKVVDARAAMEATRKPDGMVDFTLYRLHVKAEEALASACDPATVTALVELARAARVYRANVTPYQSPVGSDAGAALDAALAPFRKDGPPTQESPAVAGSSQPAPEGTT